MSFINRTCREVTRLLLQREDRPLGLLDRLGVRMHLRICSMCRGFTKQQAFTREALDRWKAYRDEP